MSLSRSLSPKAIHSKPASPLPFTLMLPGRQKPITYSSLSAEHFLFQVFLVHSMTSSFSLTVFCLPLHPPPFTPAPKIWCFLFISPPPPPPGKFNNDLWHDTDMTQINDTVDYHFCRYLWYTLAVCVYPWQRGLLNTSRYLKLIRTCMLKLGQIFAIRWHRFNYSWLQIVFICT